MKPGNIVIPIVACVLLSGCASFTVGTDKNPPRIKSEGVANGYLCYNGFRKYDGKIIEASVLSDNDRWGDIFSLEIWPVGGMGISLVGTRVKILPFELGLGVLGYEPKPENYGKEKPEPTSETEQQKCGGMNCGKKDSGKKDS